MRELIAAEWLKARTGRAWQVLLGIGVLFVLTSTFGLAAQGGDRVLAGQGDAAGLTRELVRNNFALLLFSALFGAVLVTREYSVGSISRSTLLGGRSRVLTAKLAAGSVWGLLFGVIGIVLAAGSTWLLLTTRGIRPDWTSQTWSILVGVFAVTVLAAPWGVLLGWIIRNQVAAVAVLLGLSLLVDPLLQRLIPSVAKYLMTIAMSAVYQDEKADLLSIPAGLVVILGWLVAATVVARGLLRSRDIT
jgi:hypothetical protein